MQIDEYLYRCIINKKFKKKKKKWFANQYYDLVIFFSLVIERSVLSLNFVNDEFNINLFSHILV